MRAVKGEWDATFMEPTPLSAFSRLDVPVLYLTGSESPASARGVARLLIRTLPRVTAIEVEGVGHMGPVTHPERLNALIEGYLERPDGRLPVARAGAALRAVRRGPGDAPELCQATATRSSQSSVTSSPKPGAPLGTR
jgi:hypothetical protein